MKAENTETNWLSNVMHFLKLDPIRYDLPATSEGALTFLI